jgi:ribonuclease PH
MTGTGGIVEIQGTAESAPFSEPAFLEMLALARGAIVRLGQLQRDAIANGA